MKNFSISRTVFSLVIGLGVLTQQLTAAGDEYQEQLNWQAKRSLLLLLQNISPEGTRPGVVIASPSRSEPDYWYHWVRDAALVMDVVVTLFERAESPELKSYYSRLLRNYVSFSKLNQVTPNRSGGLGEPKFNVDGSAVTKDWGRPQNDGPALRAITLTRWARMLIKSGETEWVKKYLYDSQSPTNSVIKSDLEYVSKAWMQPDFDVWEEVLGFHFFTRMAQRRALLEGAELADLLEDPFAADWYRSHARRITEELQKHWDRDRRILLPTIDQRGGLPGKNSGIDISVILGVLHGYMGDGFFGVSHDFVLSTLTQLEQSFQRIHPINRKPNIQGLAIGRYPEDRYDGTKTNSEGSPWFLATLAISEFYSRLATEWQKRDSILITELNHPFFQRLLDNPFLEEGMVILKGSSEFQEVITRLKSKSDAQFLRVLYHRDRETGSLSEQFNRHNGFMQGAKDLTWSHSSFISAFLARAQP